MGVMVYVMRCDVSRVMFFLFYDLCYVSSVMSYVFPVLWVMFLYFGLCVLCLGLCDK